MTTYNIEQVNALIKNRRSIFPKQFVPGKVIPKQIIEQMLENANWAPTHHFTEPWRFVVFAGNGLKRLAEFQSEMYRETTPAEKFDTVKFEKLRSSPLLASHIIAICMKRDPSRKDPEIEEIASVACAVQNIYLTATAYGLGGYWGTGGVTYTEVAKDFFGLGPDDKLMGFFYLGYPAGDWPEGHRRPIAEKVEWVEE